MPANSLPLFSAPAPRETLNDRLATFFKAWPNQWIDARELLNIGGFAGWRTRVSDLRRRPYHMQIENRTRRINQRTVSEYRYSPVASERGGGHEQIAS